MLDHAAVQALVALVPHSQLLGPEFADRIFVAEAPGYEVAAIGNLLSVLAQAAEDPDNVLFDEE